MPNWRITFWPEAVQDLKDLDGSQRIFVLKAIRKVSVNPLPNTEGGYGKPLHGNLAGLLKIKLRDAGLRVVYQLQRSENDMEIIVISIRENDTVYRLAENRVK